MRSENPLNGTSDLLQGFAADLRQLRQQCGQPTYRDLAKTTHYSKATLAAAASGHRLPTLAVTLAYVAACGGDTEQWQERWESAQDSLRPTRAAPTTTKPPSPSDPSAATTTSSSSRARLLLATAAATALLVTGTAAVWWGNSDHPPSNPTALSTPPQTSARFSGAGDPVTDNADPKKSGCAYDPRVTSLDQVEINTADQHFLGTAELRYSPLCQVAWGRFTPSERMIYFRGTTVTIIAVRPSTRTTGKSYRTPFDGQAAFGNILLSVRGCVEVTITIEGQAGSASSTTRCAPPHPTT